MTGLWAPKCVSETQPCLRLKRAFSRSDFSKSIAWLEIVKKSWRLKSRSRSSLCLIDGDAIQTLFRRRKIYTFLSVCSCSLCLLFKFFLHDLCQLPRMQNRRLWLSVVRTSHFYLHSTTTAVVWRIYVERTHLFVTINKFMAFSCCSSPCLFPVDRRGQFKS